MRRGIRVKGVAVFEVDKDHSVVLLELQSIGLNTVVRRKSNLIRVALNAVAEIERYIKSRSDDIGRRKEYIMVVGRKRRQYLVCIMYMSLKAPWRVKYVTLVSYVPGILKRMSIRLENMGWRRMLLFEYAKRFLTRKYY